VSSDPAESPGGTGLGRAPRRTFFSLRHRNFRLYFIGQLISNTGNWLTNVACTLLVLKLTGSGLAVGILAACQFGPTLFLSAWAGAIADRSDKRRLLLWTQSLEMAQSVGLAILAFQPHPSLVGLYVLATCGGILLAFDSPLRRSLVAEMVPAPDIPNAVVLYSTIVNVSRIFGPALAGLLAVTVGYGWCFTIDAASYLAVLYCFFLMHPAELHRRPPRPRTKGEVREGLRYALSMPVLWISLVMLGAIGMMAYNFNVTLPLFVAHALHSPLTVYTVPVLGLQLRCRGERSRRRTQGSGPDASHHHRRVGARPRDAPAGIHPGCGHRGPGGVPGGSGEHPVHDRLDRDRAGRGRS
jgi:MFS family permease